MKLYNIIKQYIPTYGVKKAINQYYNLYSNKYERVIIAYNFNKIIKTNEKMFI